MKISKHPVSLDRPVGESEDSYFGDFIEDERQEAPADTAAQDMLKNRIEHRKDPPRRRDGARPRFLGHVMRHPHAAM